MTRSEFIRSAGAAALATAAGDLFGAAEASGAADYEQWQAEIDEITPQQFKAYMAGEDWDWFGLCRRPALARLDDSFGKIMEEVRTTVVTDKPAVWLVYNMGVIVKTPQTCFSIDLMHRRAPEIAPLLDFALITHNHGDHYTEAFYQAMNGAGKTVFSNFKDNYGTANWNRDGGYTRGAKTFQRKDVTIRTAPTDHSRYLVDFTMTYEIRVGDYVIYHTGDCSNVEKLNPTVRPNLWIMHLRCGMSVADGIRKFRPETTVLAHLNELGHARDRWRWPYQEGLKVKAEAEAAGGKAVIPIWGERIV